MIAAGVVLVQCTAALPPLAAAPSPSATPSPSAAASSSASAPPAPAGATVEPVTAAELRSWRPGCPVEPERLLRVGVDHIGFDGKTHRGELVVHEDLVTLASSRWPRKIAGGQTIPAGGVPQPPKF
nr:hypothetical protein [Mycobacterium sp.]